jgi:adenylyl- and sulfurtransferase ThiI
MDTIVVRYAEIALKGAKRNFFEQKLQNNIAHSLGIPYEQVHKFHSQFIVEVASGDIRSCLEKLKHVFGISWYGPARSCGLEFEDIMRSGTELAEELINSDIGSSRLLALPLI